MSDSPETAPAPEAPAPAPEASAPSMLDKANACEAAKEAYLAAKDRAMASAAQAEEDGKAHQAAHAALKQAVADLIAAAHGEDL